MTSLPTSRSGRPLVFLAMIALGWIALRSVTVFALSDAERELPSAPALAVLPAETGAQMQGERAPSPDIALPRGF